MKYGESWERSGTVSKGTAKGKWKAISAVYFRLCYEQKAWWTH